jgi:hypothetical protein
MCRLKWMKEQPDDYLAANSVYDGVEASLMFCEFPFYIASSKKGSRVSKLATDLLKLKGFEEGSARMLTGLLPPNEAKAKALGCGTAIMPPIQPFTDLWNLAAVKAYTTLD